MTTGQTIAWRAWVGALALVLFGFALGVGTMAYVGIRQLRESVNNPQQPPHVVADRALGRIKNNLRKELDLTPEEFNRVQILIDESAANLRSIRRSSMQDSRAEMQRVIKAIAEELPPEKRKEFRQLMLKRLQQGGPRGPGGAERPERPGGPRERPKEEKEAPASEGK